MIERKKIWCGVQPNALLGLQFDDQRRLIGGL
jgi:hypothetical protein